MQVPSSLRRVLGGEEDFKEGNTASSQSSCIVPQFLSFDGGNIRPFLQYLQDVLAIFAEVYLSLATIGK